MKYPSIMFGPSSIVRRKCTAACHDWRLLEQVPQAVLDTRLYELATSCRSETERQVSWAESKLKESAVQALVTP